MKQAFVLLRQAKDGVEESGLSVLAFATEVADEVIAVVLWPDGSFAFPVSRLRDHCHEIWIVRGEALQHADGLVLGTILCGLLPPHPLVLMYHDSFAIDAAPGASILLQVPFVSNVVSLDVGAQGKVRLGRKEYGGQIDAVYEVDHTLGCFITVSGALKTAGKTLAQEPRVLEKTLPVLPSRRRWLRDELADFDRDVDITTAERLLAVGRGLQEPEQIALAEDAARAMAGVVCCSRPVVDTGRLGKARQVGISGRSVSPKIYLACGVSGSFQHMAGLKGSPFVIAVNKNPRAPIFERAQVGVVADGAEFLSRLASALREKRS
jgi:electron transfer flavoprotein alpha subunit